MGPMPNKLVFVHGKLLQPNSGNARSLPNRVKSAALVQATTLLTNISLGWKGLPGTNPLAYLASLSVMKNITLTPGDVAERFKSRV